MDKATMPGAPNRRQILTAFPAAVLALAPSGSVNAVTAIGAVTAVTGSAFADMRDVSRPLRPEAPVAVGEIVRTGEASRCAMLLAGRTTVRLGALARLRIDRFLADTGGVIDLEQGALLFDKPDQLRQGNISVRNPFALIAVRGTAFFAGPSRGVFGVFVQRGAVDVRASGRMVRVSAGQGTDIRHVGAPPTDPAAWGTARINEALASVS